MKKKVVKHLLEEILAKQIAITEHLKIDIKNKNKKDGPKAAAVIKKMAKPVKGKKQKK